MSLHNPEVFIDVFITPEIVESANFDIDPQLVWKRCMKIMIDVKQRGKTELNKPSIYTSNQSKQGWALFEKRGK